MTRVVRLGGWVVPRSVFAMLLVAAVMEMWALLGLISPMFSVGFVAIPWSAIPCLLAFCFVVEHSQKANIVVSPQRVFAYLALVIMLVLFCGLYVANNGLDVALAIVGAVAVEETVYRLAIPIAVALLGIRFGIRSRDALIVGLIVAFGLFAAMPGHRVQLQDVKSWAAFIAFCVLMSHAVWRGMSLLAPILAHATYDFVTLGMHAGDISPALRVSAAAAVLLALVVIAMHPRITVIDLRDHVKQKTVSPSEKSMS